MQISNFVLKISNEQHFLYIYRHHKPKLREGEHKKYFTSSSTILLIPSRFIMAVNPEEACSIAFIKDK